MILMERRIVRRIQRVDNRVASLEERMERVEERVERVEQRLDFVEYNVELMIDDLRDLDRRMVDVENELIYYVPNHHIRYNY